MWRAALLRVLRVPHEPEPPPGAPPQVFRAGKNFFKLQLVEWGALQAALFLIPTGLTIGVLFGASQAPAGVQLLLDVFVWIAWLSYLSQFFFTWAVLRLKFDLRWYMLSDRAVRIREGIVVVREKTMALANIQNISVKQGPLQRLLGISDVEVKTAGGGSGDSDGKGKSIGEPMHVAFFRGVDNAEEIRDLVREGVRRQRDAGLGDPDDHHQPVRAGDDDTLTAAREMLHEARALRAAVEAAKAGGGMPPLH